MAASKKSSKNCSLIDYVWVYIFLLGIYRYFHLYTNIWILSMHSVTDTFCLCPYQMLYMHNTFYISHGINNKKKKSSRERKPETLFCWGKNVWAEHCLQFQFLGFWKVFSRTREVEVFESVIKGLEELSKIK